MKQQSIAGRRKLTAFTPIVFFLLFTMTLLSQSHTPNAIAAQAQMAQVLSTANVELYVSSTTEGNIGVSFADEDIISWSALNGWSIFMDGSDVGLGESANQDVDAFYINDDGTILLSFVNNTTIPDIGSVDDSDIVRFVPISLGSNTAGTFEWYFDGSDVGLTTYGEDIDALTVLDNGDLLVSTSGSAFVPGLSGIADEDIIRFIPTNLGADTEGAFELELDGSQVGLEDRGEDIGGLWVSSTGDEVYLTTNSNFLVSGASGDEADILMCQPESFDYQGTITGCTYELDWDGSAYGFSGENIDGLMLSLLADTPVPPTATNTSIPPTATNTPLPPTATNTPLPTATNTSIPPTATSEPGATEVKINFQIAGSTVPAGYIPDYGEIYGVRYGQTYGWNMNHSDVTRDREANSDQRLDTLSHFHSGGVFEIAVANGTYNVAVSIGDASYAQTHTINVEGVNYWTAIDLAANQFLNKTQQIVVSDGRVTINQGDLGEMETRINYLEISSVSAAATATPTNTPMPPTATNTPLPTATQTPIPPTATATPGSSSGGFENCASVTGDNAIVGVPADVVINGGFLPAPGDQLAVFSSDNAICAGLATWTGSNIAIAVWGDDTQTAVLDGMLNGDQMLFRIWDQSAATEFSVSEVGYSMGDGVYLPDSMHIVSSLTLSLP